MPACGRAFMPEEHIPNRLNYKPFFLPLPTPPFPPSPSSSLLVLPLTTTHSERERERERRNCFSHSSYILSVESVLIPWLHDSAWFHFFLFFGLEFGCVRVDSCCWHFWSILVFCCNFWVALFLCWFWFWKFYFFACPLVASLSCRISGCWWIAFVEVCCLSQLEMQWICMHCVCASLFSYRFIQIFGQSLLLVAAN